MTFQFDGYNHILRLEKGESLIENLARFARDQQINGAWLSGLGGAVWAELGIYDLSAKKYQWKKLSLPLEITGLQGNIAWTDDKPIIHVHGSFSDSNMNAYSGHVKELEVGATCEVLLHHWYKDTLQRVHDPQIGLDLLDL